MITNIIKNKNRVLLFSYMGILLFLSLRTPSKTPQTDVLFIFDFDFTHADKIKHFIAYFILAFLLLRFWENAKDKVKDTIFVAVIFGIVIEVLQIFVGREFDILDMITNSVGAWCYCWLFEKYKVESDEYTVNVFS